MQYPKNITITFPFGKARSFMWTDGKYMYGHYDNIADAEKWREEAVLREQFKNKDELKILCLTPEEWVPVK